MNLTTIEEVRGFAAQVEKEMKEQPVPALLKSTEWKTEIKDHYIDLFPSSPSELDIALGKAASNHLALQHLVSDVLSLALTARQTGKSGMQVLVLKHQLEKLKELAETYRKREI